MEGNLRFKIDWACLIVGRKFTVFALFYFVFEGNFQVQAPVGLIFGGFLRYEFGELIFGVAYTWRGFFSEFHGICLTEGEVRRKVISNKIIVTLVTQGLPCSFLSRPVA